MNKILLALFTALFSFSAKAQKATEQAPNILFIAIDDLRPELGCYGNEIVQSPNLDRLAAEGMIFGKHYVTMPTCGASRYSLLSGRLPASTADLSNSAIERHFSGKPRGENPETFVEQLRRNGYYTVGIGKISHSADGYVYSYTDPKSDQLELPHSWDEMLFNPGKWETGWNAFFAYADGSNRQSRNRQVKPYEGADVADEGYPDGLSAELAVKKLKELARQDQPFFLGVGFFKPHLPFNAPKKYWDLYEESSLPLSPVPFIPENVNKASLHGSGEFNGYQLGEEKASLDHSLSDAYSRKLVHAYYAAISYTDAQVGKLLDALKEAGLEENTIVVVWGDHGWHLGDQRVWGKHTLFDQALRSPLIIRAPAVSQAGNEGAQCEQVVSTVDLYPTLMDLCGLEMPYETQGQSLLPLLQYPASRSWRNTAYSYFRSGITMVTDRYRLTRYFREAEPVTELYDHRKDPYESKNIAGSHPRQVKKLTKQWEKGNTGLYGESPGSAH